MEGLEINKSNILRLKELFYS